MIAVYLEAVAPLVQRVVKGYQCTCFAYGPTGSGKTHTMEGPTIGGSLYATDHADATSAGMISRAIHTLFDALEDPSILTAKVTVSHLEVYNEQLYDLLAEVRP